MRAYTLAACALVMAAPAPAWPPPSYHARDVRPHGADEPHPLLPGMLTWIFGANLAARSCTVRNFMDPATYATELCGTRVLAGGIPARLIFVSPGQINLRLPEHPWEDRLVDVQVIREGIAGPAVPVRFGSSRPALSLDAPVFAGMPVWLRIAKPWGTATLRYPCHPEPWDLGPGCFEVRFGGAEVKPHPGLPWPPGCHGGSWTIGLPGDYPRGYLGRLPLHLLFPLDRPGTYQVRYTEPPRPRSDWTAIEILPSTPEQRRALFATQAPQSPMELLADYLPSLLAARDEAGLRLLARHLDHPDALVRQYAAYALNYFDPKLLARVVPGRRPMRGGVR